MFAPAPFANSKLNPQISISAGNNQTASQGQAVATAPRVLVADGRGNPISGVSVTFAVTGGGGSVTSASQTTNSSGLATVGSWTLGTTAGSAQTLRCTVNNFQGTAPTVDFSATVAAASTIAVNAGNNQSANVSTNVATAPSVIVRDTLSNPCSGISVSWAVTAGGGSVNSTGGTSTNASGIAQVTSWTLGSSAGTNTLQATSAGLSGSPVSFSATAVQPKTLTYQTSSSSFTGNPVCTLAGLSIGTAASGRRVIVTITAPNPRTIDAVTIGGQAATVVCQVNGSFSVAGIAIAQVDTGTTGDVVITFSGNVDDIQVGVWSAIGLSSSTPVATGTSVADPSTATLATSSDGFCIAAAGTRSTSTMSWTSVTERYDIQNAAGMGSGADATTNGSNISPSGAYSASSGNRSGAFATW